jgi:hypothetical protein
MKKLFLLSAVMCAIIIGFGFIVTLQAAEIAYTEGSVQVKLANSEEWKKAEPGMQVNIGDSVRTAKRSKVDIILDKAKQQSVRIEQKTLLVLNSSVAGSMNKIDLSYGKVFANLEQLKGTKFDVKTPSSIAGVRGSGYGVESMRGGDEVAAYKDTVYVQTFDAQNNLLSETEVPEGFKTMIERFEAAGALTELTTQEMETWSGVKEDLAQRVEEGPVKQEEPKQDSEAAPAMEEVLQAQEDVELSAEKTSETKEQTEEKGTEKIIEDNRPPEESYH